MRNPNGYGGITYLGKNRRNPFRVRITTGWSYDEKTGKSKQNYATLGYYPTRKEAMMALADYNKDPYNLEADKVTFAEAYNAWAKIDMQNKGASRQGQLKAAYLKCEPLYKMKMKDIRKKHLQDLIDSYAHLSNTSQTNIKSIFKEVFKYCIENDFIDKDYSAFIRINAKDSEGIHIPYTEEEIAILWNNIDTSIDLAINRYEKRPIYPADISLILIYTGMRPSELLQMQCSNINLEERYMIGGLKTKAGKNRIIPIHEDIAPLIKKRMEQGNNYLVPYKIDKPPLLQQYREHIHDPFYKKINMNHLPHDGRHTFATFAERFEVNKLSIKRIMGHATADITDSVYTHKTAAELVEAVNQIVFYKK